MEQKDINKELTTAVNAVRKVRFAVARDGMSGFAKELADIEAAISFWQI